VVGDGADGDSASENDQDHSKRRRSSPNHHTHSSPKDRSIMPVAQPLDKPVAHPADVLLQEHGSKLREWAFGRFIEGGEDRHPLINRQGDVGEVGNHRLLEGVRSLSEVTAAKQHGQVEHVRLRDRIASEPQHRR
jgi:hypothetical protein